MTDMVMIFVGVAVAYVGLFCLMDVAGQQSEQAKRSEEEWCS